MAHAQPTQRDLLAELEAAERAQAQFARAFEQAPAMIAVLQGPEHVLAFHNERYAAIFPGRELAGRPIRDAMPELMGQGVFEMLDEVYRTGAPHVGAELPLDLDRDDDGRRTRHYYNFVYQPTRTPAGEVEGILVHAVDVTDQVAARRMLANENQRVEALVRERTRELEATHAALQAQVRRVDQERRFAESIVQNVPTGIAYLDRDLVYRVSNPVYSAFLRMPAEAIVGRYLFDVVVGGEDQILPLLRGVMETGKPHYERRFPFVYKTPDGEERTTYWDFVYFPAVRSPGGEVDGVLVLADEISARIAEEGARDRMVADHIAALEQNDQMKDQFLGILSHELRTPLNAIQGFGSILADGLAGDLAADQQKYVGRIQDAADALLGLVNDLLDMSRVQAGKFALDLQAVEVAALVRAAVGSVAVDAVHKGLSIVNEVPPRLPEIQADPRRVAQVLANLVTNAVKYTSEGGVVTLRAAVGPADLRLEIADTGLGVAPDQQDRIFQAFTQVDMTSTRARGGVGLGLSIVKALVEAHGGKVGVESAGVGRGSTFWFALPLARQV